MAANTGQSPSFAILNRRDPNSTATQNQPQTDPSRPLAAYLRTVSLSPCPPLYLGPFPLWPAAVTNPGRPRPSAEFSRSCDPSTATGFINHARYGNCTAGLRQPQQPTRALRRQQPWVAPRASPHDSVAPDRPSSAAAFGQRRASNDSSCRRRPA